jgi:hypothetical protein
MCTQSDIAIKPSGMSKTNCQHTKKNEKYKLKTTRRKKTKEREEKKIPSVLIAIDITALAARWITTRHTAALASVSKWNRAKAPGEGVQMIACLATMGMGSMVYWWDWE